MKSQTPPVHDGMEFGPPLQLKQDGPQAVTVSTGTQLPPHESEPVGQAQTFRIGSQTCPLPQLVLVWQPNSQRLFAGLQKWLEGHDVGVQVVGRF